MTCPYVHKKLVQKTVSKNDLVGEETGIIQGSTQLLTETYIYAECPKADCGAWFDGRCHYNQQ